MTRTRFVVPVLLLATLVGGLVAAAGRVPDGVASLAHRTSDTSYRAAVTDGGTELLRTAHLRLRDELDCASRRRATEVTITCRGTTSIGQPVLLTGRTTEPARAALRQDYRVSVAGRPLWRGSCLGRSCRR